MASQLIEQFFKDFEETSNGLDNLDPAHSATRFSETFMHADPHGVQAISQTSFINSLEKRKKFFNDIGLKKTHLTVTEEIKLNTSYTLTRVNVLMRFVKTDGSEENVAQTASYILKIDDETPQIVFYLNDQMLNDVLKAHNLLPA